REAKASPAEHAAPPQRKSDSAPPAAAVTSPAPRSRVDAPIKRQVAPPAPPPPARVAEEAPAPPKRPSSPPKTGIDVWQGRPGAPSPAPPRPAGPPPARRTTYDPRATAAAARPQTTFGPQARGPMGPRGRPGSRTGPQMQRGGPQMQRSKGPVATQEMASY